MCFGEGIYLWSDGSSVSGHSLFKYWFASFCRACKRGSEKQKQRWPFTFDTTPHFTRLFFTEDALRGLWPSLTLSYKPAGGQSTKRQTLLYPSGTDRVNSVKTAVIKVSHMKLSTFTIKYVLYGMTSQCMDSFTCQPEPCLDAGSLAGFYADVGSFFLAEKCNLFRPHSALEIY